MFLSIPTTLGSSSSSHQLSSHDTSTVPIASPTTSTNMGNALTRLEGCTSTHRVETLVVTTPVDMERAMSSTTLPKRVDLQANLLTHNKGQSVERLLKRVGCHEFCLQGKNSGAPRRVYEHQVVTALGHVKQHRLLKLLWKNIDLQRHAAHANVNIKHRLAKLTQLEELHIQSCRLDEVILQDILTSLNQLPHLKQVTINLRDAVQNDKLQALLEQTATKLIARPLLTSLALSEYPLYSPFWKAIADPKQTLTHLSLTLREEENNTTMVHPQQRQSYWDLLQRNTSIQQLELQVAPGVSLTPLAELLSENTTLTSLLLHLEEDPTEVSQWLTRVLEHDNFTLQTVHLLCHNLYGYKVRIPNRAIDFYTRLNRNGRRHLVGESGTENSTRSQEWIDTLAQNTYDLSAVYYWLHANPNLMVMVTR